MTKFIRFTCALILGMAVLACGPDAIPEPRVSLSPAGKIQGLRFAYNKASNSFFFLYTTQGVSYLESGNGSSEYEQAKVQSLTDYLRENGGAFTGDWLVDCSISGEMEVTSDLAIDGRPAGSNLSDLLYVRRLLWIHGLICSFPDYRLIGMARIFDLQGSYLGTVFASPNQMVQQVKALVKENGIYLIKGPSGKAIKTRVTK